MQELHEKRAEPRKPIEAGQKRTLFLGLAIVTILVGIAIAVAIATGVYFGFEMSVHVFVETIRSWGMWGVAGSIGLMIAHSFIPFPAEFLASANGMVYGPFWGTIITWIGAMVGASVAFGLARRLGRPFVQRMISARHWETVDDWAEGNGWQAVLVGRFIPVIAFNLINYAAGLTRISWWQFLWTTGIGILPMTIIMVVMGDNIDRLGWEAWALLLFGGGVLWLLLKVFTARRARRGERPGESGT